MARFLEENPERAVPECRTPCVLFSPLSRARRTILKISKRSKDRDALLWYSKHGNPLSRAYASTLLLLHEERVPYLGNLRLPDGRIVPYAARGRTSPFFLAGLQNFDDRELRLLSVLPFVRRRGLHVYSLPDRLVCTGSRPRPPPEFVEEVLKEWGVGRVTPTLACCPHEEGKGDSWVLYWKSARIEIERCEECLPEEGNSLSHILRFVASRSPWRDFRLRAKPRKFEARAGEPVVTSSRIPRSVEKSYLKLRLSDREILEEVRRGVVRDLEREPPPLLVLGRRTYRGGFERAVEDLDPTDLERRALKGALEGVRSVVLLFDRPTPLRLLEKIWKERGREALEGVGGKEARALFDPDAQGGEILALLEKADSLSRRRRIDEELPSYSHLPPLAALADHLARSFRLSGAGGLQRSIPTSPSENERGVILALLRSARIDEPHRWRFTPLDFERSELLLPDALLLLEGGREEYDRALRELSRKAGDREEIPPDGERVDIP